MRYGLKINSQVDERYDFEKSTKVAMRYCQDLKSDHSERWLLAFVRSPLDSKRDHSGAKKDELQNDLLTVYNLMVTSNYSAAEEYAVNQFYNNIEAYKVDRTLLKELIYEQTGIQASAFSALNPSLSGTLIPDGSKVYLTGLALDNLKKNMEDIVLLSEWRMEEKCGKA